jgi:glycosyltransferase involved in cell wall biosynthesis
VLEAMAAARPVVVFAHALAAVEWIDDGATGFVVASEDEACERIARLAADGELRQRMGLAARNAARAVIVAQRARLRAFYLGVSVNA